MRHHAICAAALAAIGFSSLAQAVEPSREELQAQLDSLKAKVEQLEQAQQNLVTKEDVNATVAAVLRDADRRSQLLGIEGFTAGYSDGKFILSSSDGNFLLHPYVQFQLRNTTSWRINGKTANGNDDMQNGFELRRAKVGIDGNAFTKDLTYAFQMAFDRKTGNPALEDAWAKYKFTDQFSFRAGQFKNTFSHESLTSTKRIASDERSYMNDIFSPGENYVQGASLIYDARGPLHVEATFHDGTNIGAPFSKTNSNSNFQDFPTNNADYGVSTRAEYLVMGDWKDYDDLSGLSVLKSKKDLLVFGAGFDYTEAGDTDVLIQTVDARYAMANGLAFYGAFMGRYTKNAPIGTGDAAVDHQDFYDWGFVAQASYFFTPKLEGVLRYDFTNFDDGELAKGLENHVHEINVGANYYLQGHNAKIQLDIGYLPNGSPVGVDGSGILANDDDEFYIRGQFQLLL